MNAEDEILARCLSQGPAEDLNRPIKFISFVATLPMVATTVLLLWVMVRALRGAL